MIRAITEIPQHLTIGTRDYDGEGLQDWARKPSPARLYNLDLGGTDHYHPDREFAQKRLGDLSPAVAIINREHVALMAEGLAAAGFTFRPRDKDTIRSLFGDWPMDRPLVPTNQWHRRHPYADMAPALSAAYAGVATKP